MSESREYQRAHLPAVRVRYEGAWGEPVEAEVRDIGRGGLFIATKEPLAPGKRLALELLVVAEPRPIAVVARVVWGRDAPLDDERPAGMGLKFIDVDEEQLERIGGLVTIRERTIHGLGDPEPPAPTFVRDPARARSDAPPSADPKRREAKDKERQERGAITQRSPRVRRSGALPAVIVALLGVAAFAFHDPLMQWVSPRPPPPPAITSVTTSAPPTASTAAQAPEPSATPTETSPADAGTIDDAGASLDAALDATHDAAALAHAAASAKKPVPAVAASHPTAKPVPKPKKPADDENPY